MLYYKGMSMSHGWPDPWCELHMQSACLGRVDLVPWHGHATCRIAACREPQPS